MSDEMISKYYEPQGKRLENIKISDRQRALHTTVSGWKTITAHLDRKLIAQQAIEKEEARRKALKEGSENMTKNWLNSIQNVRLRKEEQRIKHHKAKEEERERNFAELATLSKEQREKFLLERQKLIFKEDQAAKRINKAVMLSRTLYEREKQKELAAVIKEHDRLDDEKWAQKVRDDAAEELREKEEQRLKDLETKAKTRELFLSQKQNLEGREERERQARIAEEMQDHAKAAEELREIEEFQREEAIRKRDQYKRDFDRFRAEQDALRKKKKAEEDEIDLVVGIIKDSNDRLRCLTDLKRKQLFEEEVKRRIEAGERVRVVQQDKEAEEERIRLKVVAEKEQAEDEREEAKIAHQLKLAEDRRQSYQDYKEIKAKEKVIQDEVERWEMLNRFKHDEVIKKQDEAESSKQLRKAQERRDEIVKQICDNEERKKNEHEEIYAAKDWSETDKKFFEYADEMREYLRERGMDEAPLDREIEAYKRENGLIKRKPSKQELMETYKKSFVNLKPGKVSHHPRTDPTYGRCKCCHCKERVFQ